MKGSPFKCGINYSYWDWCDLFSAQAKEPFSLEKLRYLAFKGDITVVDDVVDTTRDGFVSSLSKGEGTTAESIAHVL
jgi:hypothetical protein